MNKRFFTILVLIMMVVSGMLVGCGNDKITGAYVVSEVSENTPYILPKAYTNGYLIPEICKIEFMSDGSMIMTVSSEGETVFCGNKDRYSIVDGRMKIEAPLGTTAISEYNKAGNAVTLTDGEGNFVVLQKI